MPVLDEAVLQHEGGDAVVAEPLRQRVALVAQAEFGVAAARAEDDGGPGRSAGVGEVRRERRIVRTGARVAGRQSEERTTSRMVNDIDTLPRRRNPGSIGVGESMSELPKPW